MPLPHEFGLRINIVGESFSAAWIAGWEIGNVVRMKMKALQKGDVPVTSLVLVRFIFIDGKLVGVGGRSYVTYVDKGDRDDSLPNPFERFPSPDFPRVQKLKGEFPHDVLRGLIHRDENSSGRDDINIPDEDESPENPSLRFFEVFVRVRGEMRDELIRNYLMYLSGFMSEGEFVRKLRSIEERSLRGLHISLFA